jgi:hypothetical protein
MHDDPDVDGFNALAWDAKCAPEIRDETEFLRWLARQSEATRAVIAALENHGADIYNPWVAAREAGDL